MKSVLTKRYVKWNWWTCVFAGHFLVVLGVFTILRTLLKGLPFQYNIFGAVTLLFGAVLVSHVTLVRGQREIKKSINDLKEKIDELEKRSKE